MSSNKELRSLTLGSAHEKFEVWTRPKPLNYDRQSISKCQPDCWPVVMTRRHKISNLLKLPNWNNLSCHLSLIKSWNMLVRYFLTYKCISGKLLQTPKFATLCRAVADGAANFCQPDFSLIQRSGFPSEETGVPGENRRLSVEHWLTLFMSTQRASNQRSQRWKKIALTLRQRGPFLTSNYSKTPVLYLVFLQWMSPRRRSSTISANH